MDKKAQQYWKDNQLRRFLQFDICYNERTDADELMGLVEHNKWKFFATNEGIISYITPTGEKGWFVDC
jgi:hypothetical protein